MQSPRPTSGPTRQCRHPLYVPCKLHDLLHSFDHPAASLGIEKFQPEPGILSDLRDGPEQDAIFPVHSLLQKIRGGIRTHMAPTTFGSNLHTESTWSFVEQSPLKAARIVGLYGTETSQPLPADAPLVTRSYTRNNCVFHFRHPDSKNLRRPFDRNPK